jgi:3-oxoadipate enol-lactonase
MTYAESGGVRIHYQDTGAGPSPLVLLSGWTVSGLVWPAPWLAALEARHRVLSLDNRGTGHSEAPTEPFTIADMAADVVAVLDDAGIERAAVLGWSMGGIVAQELAVAEPERVDALVLANSWPPGGDVRSDAITLGAGSVWTLLAGEAHQAAEELRRLDAEYAAHPPTMEGVVHQIQALQAWTLDERHLAVTQPTLVLHGAVDRLIPVDNGRRLAKLIAGAQYVELDDVGHMSVWEEPQRTAALITDFL